MNTKLSTWSLLGSLTSVLAIEPVQDLLVCGLSFSVDCDDNGVELVLAADEEFEVKGLSEGFFSVKGGMEVTEDVELLGAADVANVCIW